MRRREFITLLGGAAAVALPLVARAQQTVMKRVGVLMGLPDGDPDFQARVTAFRQAFLVLGWHEGKNVHVDYRWGIGADAIRKGAAELVGLAPDVVLVNSPPSVLALQKINRTIPMVFVGVTDPVVLGLVQSLPRPGGIITGFTSAEVGLSAKWLELLKEISPSTKRVAVLGPTKNPGAEAQFSAIQSGAASFQVELSRIDVSDPGKIERGINALASSAGGGLIVDRTAEAISARNAIIALAAKYRLPAVYPEGFCVTNGGLVSYGPDIRDDFRKAAEYVDHILKGVKPADLPVQVPTKYVLAINLKTAKALDLSVPSTLLARADEVID
jgi:putative ABC transport system substrate-binding protein